MEMLRSPMALFLLSLVLVVCVADARKDPGEYWMSVMKGEPMPRAIKDLFHQNPASDSNMGTHHFTRNFGTKPNVIIYHSRHHVHSQEPNP